MTHGRVKGVGMSCKHKMIETKCSTCGIVDRFCTNLCGEGSGHAHADGGAGLTRQLDHKSNKQLIAQIREGVMKLPTIHRQKHTRDGVQVDAGCLDPADVLDLLENIEKELG